MQCGKPRNRRVRNLLEFDAFQPNQQVVANILGRALAFHNRPFFRILAGSFFVLRCDAPGCNKDRDARQDQHKKK